MATIRVSNLAELRSACQTGGDIILPDDTITIPSKITITKPCNFIGADDFGTIFTIPDDFGLAADVPLFGGEGVTGITFNGIQYDGNASEQSVSRGKGYFNFAELRNCPGLKVTNCWAHDAMCDFMRIRNTKGIVFSGNNIKDLGHEALYALSCSGIKVFNNKAKTMTNTFTRLSYSASDVEIYNNIIMSEHTGNRSGPAIEADKGPYSNINIHDNTFMDIYGAAIWAFGEQGNSCSNFRIHHNNFENCGKYPSASYSQGILNTGGLNNIIFEENILDDAWYAIRYYNYKGVSGSFKVTSRNNVIKNISKIGYYVSSANGSIEVINDSRTNVEEDYSGNVDITNGTRTGTAGVRDGATPDNPVDPIENTTGTDDPSTAKVTVRVTTAEIGRASCRERV